VLESIYRVSRSAGRQLAFDAYREREGRSLDDFAIWCALAERHGPDWHRWPKKVHQSGEPRGGRLRHQARRHRRLSTGGCKWQLDEQLAAAQSAAVRRGMELGIMHDLAVGVDPNGADAWAMQDVLALGVTAGAPPTSSISWARTGLSRRGGPTSSSRRATNRSGRWSTRS
jgi:4-alpha-glucanotransferase